ncbi:MAG TPA: hypothetical protein VMZ26_02795 [Pyrinomonadaceae bacterium]|nr:hypothetical protein [Pyrinomonadaceae bacterium]
MFLSIYCLLVITISAQSPSPTPIVHKKIHRWIDIETLSAATRYRYVETDGGQTASIQQYQLVARVRFKFDSKGKYSVVAGMAPGNSITSGWNLTGWGTGDAQGDFNVKQLFLEAKPIKPLEIQFGGIAPNNGENTEITGYDNDVYLMGERVRILHPKKLYFDEISATNAFIGDPTRPNVFRRFNRLAESNYHQILVHKTVNKRASFSADYTFDSGTDTLRQAVKVNVPELKLVDSLRFENYERIDPQPGYGFGLTGEKKVTPKLSFIGGVTKISHAMLNGDRYPRGTRLFLGGTYKITRELSINPILIQGVGPLPTAATPRTRFEIIATYNFLEALHHLHIF